ncbi:putative F-box protein At3g58860 [Rosa chinensis]|uniref:putative F-box protein At3g58860 n=1 Tax=Rosa chinensis TaxID=74649 RepID=UPI001AD8FAB4|nr:putative F-box protein At3g58860 [Rosa chinensis]
MIFVSKQWEGVWFSDPILDFDESIGNYYGHAQHEKFVKFINNILKRYLKFCDDQELKLLAVKKFRLCMRRYLSSDAPNVDKWLSLLFERSIEELDISLISGITGDLENYSVSHTTLVNAKSLTSLNLECVTIKNMDGYYSYTYEVKKRTMVPRADDLVSKCLLPSLKTMSLKTVQFDHGALFPLIWECPVIEFLSLTSCSFENCRDYCQHLFSSSLKFLNIDKCNFIGLRIGEAVNLESFRLVSPLLEDLVLDNCVKLKDMNIENTRWNQY